MTEREKALQRGEKIINYQVDEDTALSQLLDRHGAKQIALDLVQAERAAVGRERESIAVDAAMLPAR